jgi:hypothetical protein
VAFLPVLYVPPRLTPPAYLLSVPYVGGDGLGAHLPE